MAVQIFQNEELNDLMFEVDALQEWEELASELGLDAQLESVKGKESPNPYPYMNKGIYTIMESLCPTKVNFKKYDKTPIPLEVMKQLAFSVRDKHFNEIEIWYDDKTPDPCAVGITYRVYGYDSGYNHLKDENDKTKYFTTKEECGKYAESVGFKISSYGTDNRNSYLIARWSDVLRPFEELKSLAKERLIEKYGAEIKNELEEKQQALKKLTENVILFLNGEINEGQLKGARW
jgi:hypothetical protein